MKVLIVEDEVAIIDMIRKTTSWESLGIHTILTAENGKEALEVIEEEMPDIIISDIEMPVMDGLTMAEHISDKVDTTPVVIFLTCHAEFHYAQRAIRCGVTDYLLKPFFPEELTAVLSKAVVKIQEQKHTEEPSAANRGFIRQSFFRDILNHVYDNDTSRLKWAAKKYGISFDEKKWKYMIGIGIPVEEALKQYSKSQLIFMFGNVCNEIFFGLDSNEESEIVDYIIHNYYTAYIFLNENQVNGIDEKCSRLTTALRQYLDLNATCIISDAVKVTEIADIRDRMEAMLSRTMGDVSSVMKLKNTEEESDADKKRISKSNVLQFIRERKKSELFLYMRHFLEQPLNSQEMVQLYRDIQQVFFGYLYENRIDTTDFMQDEVSRKISDMAQYSTMNMMKYVSFLYDSVVRYIEELKKSQSVIERAKQFIAEHFMEDIGRTEIAQEVLLAPNYLSMLFHKETGQTIREYINYCRVEEAKKIMTLTNNSITDVAMQVGFDNISYFSTVFKKYTGGSPAEFRHSLQDEQEGQN